MNTYSTYTLIQKQNIYVIQNWIENNVTSFIGSFELIKW